eukprot:3218943-Pleurochrysis_carterae.AAC.3
MDRHACDGTREGWWVVTDAKVDDWKTARHQNVGTWVLGYQNSCTGARASRSSRWPNSYCGMAVGQSLQPRT